MFSMWASPADAGITATTQSKAFWRVPVPRPPVSPSPPLPVPPLPIAVQTGMIVKLNGLCPNRLGWGDGWWVYDCEFVDGAFMDARPSCELLTRGPGDFDARPP